MRTVPEVTARTESPLPPVPDDGPTYATHEDLERCHGLVLGSPTRFGNMAAALKYFIDGTSAEWLSGALAGKPAGVFTSTSSMHGGHESTLLTMALPLIHHGMVLVGVPFTETAVGSTVRGGSPYGAGHIAATSDDTRPDNAETAIARKLGGRVAEVAVRLADWEGR